MCCRCLKLLVVMMVPANASLRLTNFKLRHGRRSGGDVKRSGLIQTRGLLHFEQCDH